MATGDPFAGGHYRWPYCTVRFRRVQQQDFSASFRVSENPDGCLDEFLYNYHNSNALPLCT